MDDSESMTEPIKKKSFGKAIGGVAGVGVFLAALGLALDYYYFTNGGIGPTTPPDSNSQGERPDEESNEPDPPSPPDTTPPPSPDALASIIVETAVSNTIYGKAVGDEYQMHNGHGYIKVAYGWSGRRANDTEVVGETCDIVVDITGPENIPSETYAQCSNHETDFFNASDNDMQISTPGTYEITVTDEKTGVSGSKEITILGE
ncbi:hypothetical protein P4U43_06220 [Arthrobacter sp. EH-1B-1]|uniref:Uncharacterized protein n=1 Tax=Arthrobacter vasquezii TaxID=2977629 RepID=A0ABT6CTM4_9MICC|nr:hypothetical protein [Arthrobacter vasquezii]MDF9277388.1 hypothetical protein [Arthrobacter vasquezii]